MRRSLGALGVRRGPPCLGRRYGGPRFVAPPPQAAALTTAATPKYASLEELREHVGKDLGWSEFIEIGPERVRQFADATNDWQWIHLDPERATREGPFGGPVAHGFLSLSLVVPFLDDVVGRVGGVASLVNIGVNRVRFIAPVPVGERLRARFTLLKLEDTKDGAGAQATYAVECWTERGAKPAVLVESVIRYLR